MGSEGLVRTNTCVRFGIPIGVDVRRRNLLTLAPVNAGPKVEESLVADGTPIMEGYIELRERYESTGYDGALASQLDAPLTRAAANAVGCTQSFDEPPMLVLEDLNHRTFSLADCVAERDRLACWLLATIQDLLTAIAYENGPVATTTEWGTTKITYLWKACPDQRPDGEM